MLFKIGNLQVLLITSQTCGRSPPHNVGVMCPSVNCCNNGSIGISFIYVYTNYTSYNVGNFEFPIFKKEFLTKSLQLDFDPFQ